MSPDVHAIAWRDATFPAPSAIALGNFDGVHLGHRHILEALRTRSEAASLRPLALTFEPHPRQFLSPDAKTSLLTTPKEKEERIDDLGIRVITLAFDGDLAALSAEEFVSEVLIRRLRGECFFLGSDHRFGKNARGDAALLRSLTMPSVASVGPEHVVEIPPVTESGEDVSSTAIRRHLKAGKIDRANAMLGRPYALRGTVVPGAERGRALGFPTANLRLEDPRKILPYGVFGGFATVDGGSPLPAVGNIGMRPTFTGTEPSVEVHLLDWNGDLYGREMTFELHLRIREERRFDSVEALRSQIGDDTEQWRRACPPPPKSGA